MKKWGLYEWSVILFFFVVPATAIVAELLLKKPLPIRMMSEIALKWMVFSGVGLRLGSAGLKQIKQPQFTAKEIFRVSDERAISLVKEVGFANVSFSSIALISLIIPSFRLPAAIAGGLYFGLAGLLHIQKVEASSAEKFAMVSDIYIFIVLLFLVIFTLK
ncbi:DUF6790 family protein [Lactovum odontotermitis]